MIKVSKKTGAARRVRVPSDLEVWLWQMIVLAAVVTAAVECGRLIRWVAK